MKRNDEKYNKFLKKFERKKREYLMVLGGSLSEGAKNFDESNYLETIFLPIARLTLLNFFIASSSFVVKGSTTLVPGGPIPETPPA